MPRGRSIVPVVDRLLAKVDRPQDPDEQRQQCWRWLGAVTGRGPSYGPGHPRCADGSPARILYRELRNPALPDGVKLRRYRCSRIDCVNPWHFCEGSARRAEEFAELNRAEPVPVVDGDEVPAGIDPAEFAELCRDLDDRIAAKGRKPLAQLIECYTGSYSPAEVEAAVRHLGLELP